MEPPKISVVVPVYKAEAYLRDCITSILTQSFTNFELILVNDGSPDGSGALCDCAAEQDSRVRVLHQKNQGVTRARANGVWAAQGEFITFVDSDDTLVPDALETLIVHADANTDIVLGNIILSSPNTLPPGELSLGEYRQMCVVMKTIHNGPVAKLFRRSLFNEWVFNMPRELRVGEDAIMNIRLAYQATGKIYNTGEGIYEYRANEESVMHTLQPSPEMDVLFEKYRLSSFPQEDLAQHIKAGLYKSLIRHWLNALHHTPRLPSSVLEHRRFLLSIKKESGYKFNLYTYILFHCPNQTCLQLFIKLWKRLTSHKKGVN